MHSHDTLQLGQLDQMAAVANNSYYYIGYNLQIHRLQPADTYYYY